MKPALVSTQQQSQAWAFVLQRSQQIDKFAGRFFRMLSVEDQRDARSDYIARIVEKHPDLRLEDAVSREMVISTWLGWQARAVQTTYCRRYKKFEAQQKYGHFQVMILASDPPEMASTDGANTPEAIEESLLDGDVSAVVEQLFATATKPQREAMLTILLEMDFMEMRKTYKLSMIARNQQLAALRAAAVEAGITLN